MFTGKTWVRSRLRDIQIDHCRSRPAGRCSDRVMWWSICLPYCPPILIHIAINHPTYSCISGFQVVIFLSGFCSSQSSPTVNDQVYYDVTNACSGAVIHFDPATLRLVDTLHNYLSLFYSNFRQFLKQFSCGLDMILMMKIIINNSNFDWYKYDTYFTNCFRRSTT